MQHGEKGDAGIVRKRIAQGERMVSRQLDHEPVGQSGRVAVFIIGRLRGLQSAVEIGGAWFEAGIIAGDGNDMHSLIGGFVLVSDVAALDAKQAVIAKADEGTGLGLLRFVEYG